MRSRLPSWAAMTTTYADLFSYKGVTPYIGAGIGISRNDMPDMVVNGQQKFGDSVFRLAWKAAAGIGVDLPKIWCWISVMFMPIWGGFRQRRFSAPLCIRTQKCARFMSACVIIFNRSSFL